MRTLILAVTGLFIGVAACSDGGTSVIFVERSPVASISVALPSSSLLVGQTTRGTATVLDAAGALLTDRVITWQTSNAAVAVVDNAGTIAAVAPGNAVISAVSEGVTGQVSVAVMDPSPAAVASVSVALGTQSLNPGQTTQATATTRDASSNVLAGRTVAWRSSNTAVATVAGTGVVSAVGPGSAQIIATSEGQSGYATLTVAAPPPVPVASVTVALGSSSLNPGQTTQATATTRDASNNVLTGRAITWSSSNNGVATVSASGLVTAIAVGTVQILASCEGQSGSGNLTVVATAPAPVASVTVSLVASSLNPGATTQATAVTRDANNNVLSGRAIVWSTGNNALATVLQSGLVTALAIGTVQITAMSEGQSGSTTLDVRVPGSSNEPTGMTPISERPFNAINELGWNDAGGAFGTIISDPTAPKSPSNVLQIRLPAGFGEGGGPFSGEINFSNYRTIYVSYWAKYSSNWYGPSSGINKTFYLYTSLGAPSLVFDMDANGNGPMETQVAGQNILAGGIGTYPGDPFWMPNLASGIVARGQWHHVEFVAVGNTAGNKDGKIDWYLNGVHVGSYSGIQFQTGNTTWNLFHYTLLYTGTNSSTPPADQYNFWDHIYISGK